MSQGKGYEHEVISKIETLTSVPATTSIVAGMGALRALSVRRVGLVNPYPSELNDAVVAFMKAHGFEVSEADVYAAAKQAVKQSPKIEVCIYPVHSFRRWRSSTRSNRICGFRP